MFTTTPRLTAFIKSTKVRPEKIAVLPESFRTVSCLIFDSKDERDEGIKVLHKKVIFQDSFWVDAERWREGRRGHPGVEKLKKLFEWVLFLLAYKISSLLMGRVSFLNNRRESTNRLRDC